MIHRYVFAHAIPSSDLCPGLCTRTCSFASSLPLSPQYCRNAKDYCQLWLQLRANVEIMPLLFLSHLFFSIGCLAMSATLFFCTRVSKDGEYHFSDMVMHKLARFGPLGIFTFWLCASSLRLGVFFGWLVSLHCCLSVHACFVTINLQKGTHCPHLLCLGPGLREIVKWISQHPPMTRSLIMPFSRFKAIRTKSRGSVSTVDSGA